MLPFALSTLCYYIYNFLWNNFRSLKFGLLLFLILLVCVTQLTATLKYEINLLYYRTQYFANLQYYSYMLTPAKTWLFSAQYFESASLVIEYSNKEKI